MASSRIRPAGISGRIRASPGMQKKKTETNMTVMIRPTSSPKYIADLFDGSEGWAKSNLH
jgi:hypothetical protein